MAENLTSDVELIPKLVSIAYNALEIVGQYHKHKEILFRHFSNLLNSGQRQLILVENILLYV